MYDHDHYYYDKAGNLLTDEHQGAVPDNRLPGYGRDRYRYNEWGELTERRDQQLEWNAQGQLTRVVSSNSETWYQYDALGRRISKATYGRHTDQREQRRTTFVWEGFRLLQETTWQGKRTYPETQIQLCIVHMVRNSLRFVAWKDYKAVTRDLKQVYRAATEEGALQALDVFGKEWDARYPQISRSWRANWPNIATFFVYPEAIRKVIYTTNAIESLNSVIRHAIKKRKVFPTDESVKKVVWLAIQSASQKWTMPLQDWRIAMSRFIIEFGDRLDGHF